MRKNNFVHLLYKPFYDKNFYFEVAQNWKGSNLLNLLLVLMIFVSPSVLQITFNLQSEVNYITRQLPEFMISDGVVRISSDEIPYIIKNSKNKEVIRFDPRVKIENIEGLDSTTVITDTKVIIINNPYDIRVYDLGMIKNITLHKDTIARWTRFAFLLIVFIFPFMTLFFYLYQIILACLVFLVGMILRIGTKSIDHLTLFRLSVVATCPVIVIEYIAMPVNIHIPYKFLLSILISSFFLYSGIRHIKFRNVIELTAENISS